MAVPTSAAPLAASLAAPLAADDAFWADADRHLIRYAGAGAFTREIIDHAAGSFLFTQDGRQILDFMRSLDTPEVHGLRADLGYRVYLPKEDLDKFGIEFAPFGSPEPSTPTNGLYSANSPASVAFDRPMAWPFAFFACARARLLNAPWWASLPRSWISTLVEAASSAARSVGCWGSG